jgi:lysophospholipase L1-like esterase
MTSLFRTPVALPWLSSLARQLAGGMAILAAGLGLTACGGGGDETVAAPPTATPLVAPGTWVVLGSSTAAGVGAPSGQGWVDLLARHVQPRGVQVQNLARNGLQSSQALPVGTPLPLGRPAPDAAVNLDAALASGPALLLLAFPTNDAVAGVPAADTVAAWRLMAQRAAAAGASTLVLSTQPRAGLSTAQLAVLEASDREASSSFGPCFVPLRAGLAGPDGAPSPAFSAGDGIHLNAAGHAWVQARVVELLESGRCVRLTAG